MIDWVLLSDMYYAAPEVWYILSSILLLMFTIVVWQAFQILRLKQKNYFLNRDRERYAETLYASRDGYFAFIYPDQKVNDPRQNVSERCSRRLAVIMNLSAGVKSSFEDILKNFYKEDAKKIQKYVSLLRDDGVSFDDEFMLKSANKYLRLVGARINGIDGNIYCDMIWFRDISFETAKISSLEKEKKDASTKLIQIQDLIDNLTFPIWLRNDKLKIIKYNKKFAEMSGLVNSSAKDNQDLEINTISGDSVSKELAKKALNSNKTRKSVVNIVKDGERMVMTATETPFHAEESLDKIYTVGSLVDISELDELKRNLKEHQNAQLEILGTLGTAFAVFDGNYKLAFYNKSFADLWLLDTSWLENSPAYTSFLDVIREKRLLPEVPDYVMFKRDELKKFESIIETQRDLLHLPSGKTIRRLRAPYPAGGLIFAFEDITDRLATTSAYNALLSVQKEILENLFDAVLIFGTNGRLNFYNNAYVKMWKASEEKLKEEPNLDELIDMQKPFFNKQDDWKTIKENIVNHLSSMTTKSFELNRNKKDIIEVAAKNLSDGSLMVTYKKL
ncbi:MAG: PAS domain S-box protein [Alphaproteobacteria bacterium]|nr:PAS domain S-box protein [Alphaproteobacteria bacterium]